MGIFKTAFGQSNFDKSESEEGEKLSESDKELIKEGEKVQQQALEEEVETPARATGQDDV